MSFPIQSFRFYYPGAGIALLGSSLAISLSFLILSWEFEGGFGAFLDVFKLNGNKRILNKVFDPRDDDFSVGAFAFFCVAASVSLILFSLLTSGKWVSSFLPNLFLCLLLPCLIYLLGALIVVYTTEPGENWGSDVQFNRETALLLGTVGLSVVLVMIPEVSSRLKTDVPL